MVFASFHAASMLAEETSLKGTKISMALRNSDMVTGTAGIAAGFAYLLCKLLLLLLGFC